jgi:hypothetical protein
LLTPQNEKQAKARAQNWVGKANGAFKSNTSALCDGQRDSVS